MKTTLYSILKTHSRKTKNKSDSVFYADQSRTGTSKPRKSQQMISRRMIRQLLEYMNDNEIVRMSADDILKKISELEAGTKGPAGAAGKAAEMSAAGFGKKGGAGNIAVSEQMIHELCQETGWSRFQVLQELAEANDLYGVNPAKYCRFGAFTIPKENFNEVFKARVAQEKIDQAERKALRAEEARAGHEEAIKGTMEKTGWPRKEAVAKMRDAQNRTGCWLGQYYYFRFYELSPEEQATYLTQGYSSEVTARYDVSRYISALLRDKERTNYFFADYIRRPWCVNTKVTEQEFAETFKDTDRLFYKPLHNNHGTGAELIDLSKEDIHNVYMRLKDYDEGVVEGYVKQHEKMNALAPNAVNTLRIVSLSSNTLDVGAPGRHSDIAYISIKLSGETGCVDNLAGGGMVAGVDMSTGRICTDAVDEKEHVFVRHPVTGMEIRGFEIPFFKEAVEMVYDAIKRFDLEGYFGWDIAITDEGPELIETNVQPGTILAQLPYVPEKKGVRYFLEKYMQPEAAAHAVM